MQEHATLLSSGAGCADFEVFGEAHQRGAAGVQAEAPVELDAICKGVEIVSTEWRFDL